MVDIELLNLKARFYSEELWGIKFNMRVTVSKRYFTTFGEFSSNDRITISNKILDNELFTDDVLLHELCHWYCCVMGKNYSDNSTDFINEIKISGAHMSGVLNKMDDKYYGYKGEYVPKQKLIELNKKFYEEYNRVS